MASRMVHRLREMVRTKPSEWLEACISPGGRATAPGWYAPGADTPHTEGAIAIALIRAELRRRARRAQRTTRRTAR